MIQETPHVPIISVRNVSKTFAQGSQQIKVLDKISLSVGKNEFLCVVGPSGCGKSTLLSLISGLDSSYEGSIEVEDRYKSRIAFVFQGPRLLPWRNVWDNVKYGLQASRAFPEPEWNNRISEVISTVGLEGFEKAYPNQLSGGMQTRVSIARAFAIEPGILLMDEPFSNLDEITARKLRKELLAIWERKHVTVVFVTHDISESVFLADRILLLTPRPGRLRKEVIIDMPRPRLYSNLELITYESALLGDLEGMLEESQ